MVTTVAKDVSFNRIPAVVRERWRVVRDVISGDQALRAGNYLPTLNKADRTEANVARNAAYRQRAVWYPATSFTLEGLIGLAFRIDPQQKIENTRLNDLLNNIDGGGVSLYQQSQASLANVLQVGRHGLFVDWAEALQMPVVKPYTAESIINWRYQYAGGKAVLSMIVLEENVEVESGKWALETVKQWREIWLDERGFCNVRVWQEDVTTGTATTNQPAIIPVMHDVAGGGQTDTLLLRSRGRVLDFIPFVFIGSNSNDGNIDGSPLYGLSQVNLAHFRNSADYEDSVFFVGQAQPYITGLDQEWRDFLQNPTVPNPRTGEPTPTGQTMYVGSRTPILLPQGATFGFAQVQPNTLVGEAMQSKEEQMIKIGARLIEATQAGKTATGENNDREATTSVLSMCVANVNEAYQKALWYCAQFLDLGESFDTSDAYKINQDFTKVAPDQTIVAELVKSWQTGIIAKTDVRAYFRRMGLIATERGDDDIEGDLAGEGPALGLMGEPGSLPGGNPAVAAPNAGRGGAQQQGAPGAPVPPDSGPSPTPETGGSTGTANDDPSPRPASGAGAGDGNRNVVPLRRAPDATEVTPIPNREPAPQFAPFDLAPILEAIRAGFASIRIELPAINIAPPAINIDMPAPTVNVEAPTVNVAAPVVNVAPPNVSLPTMNVVVEKGGGNKQGRLIKTANGYEVEVSEVPSANS